MKRTRTDRRRRGANTLGALLRAALLFGPLGAILGFATLAGTRDAPTRLMAMEGVDEMTTGSVGAVHHGRPAVQALPSRPNGGPCLRFPDGSQRGSC